MLQYFAANRFDHWDDDSTARTRTVTITGDTQVTAHYHTTTNHQVTVRARDLDDNGASIPGLCVFVDGATQCAGFTPFTTTLAAGSHTIAVADFGNNVFHDWDNGTTTRTLTVQVTGNATYDAHFHSR